MSRRTSASSEPAAPAVHTEPKSSATVTIACKIPSGLVLQLCKPTKWVEETPSGGKDRIRYDKTGPRHYVAGPAYPNGQAPENFPERPAIAGGFALTSGIPKDFWDAWLKQNEESSFVLNGQVFARPTFDAAQGVGREMHAVRSGFEPMAKDLDPRKDPRLPTPVAGIGVDQVKPADEMAGRAAA